ncbi:MAG: hypothetical protein ACREUT_10650, partial [Steroidobacteraceae bacterium]
MTADACALIRRLAARTLSDYCAPAPSHLEELFQSLEGVASNASPGGEWAALSEEIIAALRQSGARRFLRLPPIRRTVHPPMRSLGRRYWSYLERSQRFNSGIQMALTESPVGQPLLSPHYPLTSPLLMQHGYHLVRLLESTDFDLASIQQVFEFGGGYGSFFRLLRNLGYRNRYLICDLPPMCALQRFYVRNVFPTGPEDDVPENLEWVPAGRARTVERQLSGRSPGLFIATWSLSEAPPSAREEIEPVLPAFDYILC